MQFKSIGIAGLGLIGGSFAKAFACKGIKIYGFDLNKSVITQAVESRIFEGVTDEFERFINFPLDLLYICVPVKSALEFINRLGESGYKKAVTDGCSTKTTIIQAAKDNKLYFCGGHPVRGKETSGFINSETDLYNGAKHILTSMGYKELDDALEELHLSINMKVCKMTAAEHDRIFANVSHLPHLISFCLMDTVLSKNKDALSYAGGGFRDFTRIAASDAEMWSDIFLDNKDAVLECVENLEKDIHKWKNMIKDNDKNSLFAKIEEVSGERRKL